MCDPNESPIDKINHTWDLNAINRMVRLIMFIETDYPIHSVSVSIGRSSSTTPLQYSSIQEKDNDVPDLDRMQRKKRECSAEHIGDKFKDGGASV